MKTDLSKYDNSWFDPGGSRVSRALWYITSAVFFQGHLFPFSGAKSLLLRLFGATVGTGVNIKPAVTIKYPWLLVVGNYCWIGEQVWIDNLAQVRIGDHVCISQGAMLLTGNHDYRKQAFDLVVRAIVLEDGVWIGARSTVGPGVTCRSHAVLAAQSFTSADLEAYQVYAGNPAVKVRSRVIS